MSADIESEAFVLLRTRNASHVHGIAFEHDDVNSCQDKVPACSQSSRAGSDAYYSGLGQRLRAISFSSASPNISPIRRQNPL